MMRMASWGRLAVPEHDVIRLTSLGTAAGVIAAANHPGIAYGMGRSYGDECLNSNGTLWTTRGLDHLISFDHETGRLVCEAGVLLRDIQRTFIPRGWMLPVTPGTLMATVGGAIANDVHGKNHHVFGSFGHHVQAISLARSDGSVMRCARDAKPGLFEATIGGLGLTGVILTAELQLVTSPGAWLDTETIPYRGLHEFFALSDQSEADWQQTVSWIDCLSGRHPRGVFLRSNPVALDRAAPGHREKAIPLTPPVSLVNRASLKVFNEIYYRAQARKRGKAFAHYESFTYPLDAIHHWNRIYGPRGFYQYQCVIPRKASLDAISDLLEAIRRDGAGSFLAVLKTFSDRPSPGMLSFPHEGATLAVDFPNQGQKTLQLFERLDRIVSAAGGRLYPAKDAHMSASMFREGYTRLPEFIPHRDPGLSSDMSRRLLGS